MSADEAFIQDIFAHPDDLGLRLIYADWLDERNDPRGTFLRAESDYFSVPEDDERRPEMRQRLREMANHLDPRWRARLDSHLRISSYARRLFTKLTDAEMELLVRAMGADDVQDVIRRTARFNWHGRAIRAVLRQRGITSILMQALLR